MSFTLIFVTGVFIGMFLYVTVFKPVYVPEEAPAEVEAAREFSVIGQAYGGMRGPEFVRPSFRILGDGRYTYQPGGVGEGALRTETGTLPADLLASLRSEATEPNLLEAAAPAQKADCRLFVDGYDYRYQFTVSGTVYSVDTCESNVTYSDELVLLLDEVWSYVLNPTQYVPRVRPDGTDTGSTPASGLERWLREQLRGEASV